MDRAPISVLYRRLLRVRGWPLWSLPRPLLAFVLAVIGADMAWIGVSAATFRFHDGDALLFGALLACGAATVELTRRASEPVGVAKDVYAVWELPMVILLPPLYALLIPAIRFALTQWRVRRAAVYRRVFSAAAISVAYGCGAAVYRGLVPAGGDTRAYLWSHTAMWLGAAGACAVTQWVVNQALVLTAAKSADPSTRILQAVFGKEALHNDGTELCAAILVTLGLVISALTLIIALPLATLLQRSFRHAQLLNEARADSKTGLLNAATWEREAGGEVARAVRTGTPLAVALLDLDRFKVINDTYGHLVGDQVLRQIASTMTEVLRDYDLAGRFGGEEFVMLLPQTRAVDALRIAERVRAHISQLPIYAGGGADAERVPVTVSIGVAALDAGSRRELTELLAAADAALYRAKASGRDQVQMISTSRGLSAVRPASSHAADGGGTLFGGLPLTPEVPAEAGAPGTGPNGTGPNGTGPTGNGSSGARAADGAPGTGHGGEEQSPAARQPSDDGSASTATTSALPV
jgi:diguanylate cyclase (GGDEF)-like protein